MSSSRRLAAVVGLVIGSGLGATAVRNVSASPAIERAQTAVPCPDPVDPIEPVDLAEFETLLAGTWVLCDEPLLTPTSTGEVGIEIAPDGRFYRVHEGDDGALICVERLAQEGSWAAIDMSEINGPGSYQVDLTILGSGTIYALPEFYGTPSSFRTQTMTGTATYVSWTGAPTTPGVPPGLADGPCGLPTDPVELSSVEQVGELLAGTWLQCGDDSAIGSTSWGEVGLEFIRDGRWFRVYRQPEGFLIRAEGSGQEGTWSVLPDVYQLDLVLPGGGPQPSSPTFLASPAHLRLVVTNGVADYQQWSGADPVAGAPPVEPSPPVSDPPPTTLPPTTLPPTGSTALVALLALTALSGGAVLFGVSRRNPGR